MTLDIDALRATPLATIPYPHVIVPDFLGREALSRVARDFPSLDMPGSFPPDTLSYGPAFAALLNEMEGEELRRAVEEKFGLDLAGRPSMCTIRGATRASDGQIHRDASFKIVTLLLYLNDAWAPDGGRLRVLRSATDLEDYVTEIPPNGGTLFAFLCTPEAWHGHKPFNGPRRTLQLNYVSDAQLMRREMARHRLSARMKKMRRILGIGRARAA